MATMCSRCGTGLDAVPGGEPCPTCGKSRVIDVLLPSGAAMSLSGGAITVEVIQAAIVELASLPEQVRQEVARIAIAAAVDGVSGQPADLGVDPRDAPALHRLWRDLPPLWVVLLVIASLVGKGFLNEAGKDLYRALANALVPVKVQVAEEPVPAKPLPPLVTPEDEVCAPQDADPAKK